MGRRALPAAALALLALSAAACSGSGAAASSGDATLSRRDFAQRAAAICTRYRGRIGALSTPTSLSALADQGDRAVGLQQQELAELRALRPPAAIAGRVVEMLADVADAVTVARTVIAAARSGDVAAVQARLGELRTRLEAANAIARQLDLGACAVTA